MGVSILAPLGKAPLPPPSQLHRMHAAQRDAVLAFARQPRNYHGRGIVTTVFDRQIASCWVMLSELARLGVTLPIEAFHLKDELSPRHAALVESLGLDLKLRLLKDNVAGFAIKPFAIWRSSFQEVLWIDSDNFPIRDPEFLFDDPEYRKKGSLFWRSVAGTDRAIVWHPSAPVWQVFDVPTNDAEEFESGQLLIDKEKCWAELGLTLHFNEQRQIYYRYVWGDKDTFRMAWQNLAAARKKHPGGGNYLRDPRKVPYGFMPYGPFHMGRENPSHKWGGGTVLVQRDRQGAPLFNHRVHDKFKPVSDNVFNADITNEAIYHEHVKTLREKLAAPVS